MAQFTKRYVHTSHVEFMNCFITPFILQQLQYCEICVQESSFFTKKIYCQVFFWKLKKEVRIKTRGLKRGFNPYPANVENMVSSQ